jgi:hypothetical protein
MNKISKYIAVALGLTLISGVLEFEGGPSIFVSQAQAVVGRPLTPLSGAGVARRTTRRVIRRGAFIRTIPMGCAYGTYYGYSLYHCGGVYYQRSGNGYVIVTF